MSFLSESELRKAFKEEFAAEIAASVELDALVTALSAVMDRTPVDPAREGGKLTDVDTKLASVLAQDKSTWTVSAEATAAAATATRVAEVGKSHYIVAVVASYGVAQIGGLDINDGAVAVISTHVHNAEVIALPRPLKATAGNAVSATLGAGAAGVVGRVNVIGFTV